MHRTALFVTIAAILSAAPAAPAAGEVGRIKASSGLAQIERAKARIAAVPGALVEAGDVLVTGKNGRLALTFVDNTRFAVGPGSRVAVDKFLFDRKNLQGEFLTRVDRGSLAVVSGQIAKSGRDAMKVRTPTSLLGVRGTRFVIDVP